MKTWKRILLLWCALTGCALAVNKPSTITYVDNVGNTWIYAFTVGSTGHLVVRYFDGSTWHWADQGLPPGATGVEALTTAITYRDAIGNQRIYAFVLSNNNHLVVNYWDGAAWHWADQGTPAGTTIVGNPSAITYLDSTGHQRIYIFAEDGNGRLAVNYWNGAAWFWADQGLPGGTSSVFDPSVITYLDSAGTQRIYAFAEGSNGHLVVNYWDEAGWHWADQGLPAGVSEVFEPSAITYVDNMGHRLIYVAVTTLNDICLNYWNGAGWYWANQGHPAGFSQLDAPSAITYLDSSGNQRIYISVTSLSDLLLNYWDGSAWHWADLGLPPGVSYVSQSSAIVIQNTSPWIFAVGSDGDLELDYGNGSFWIWWDQGIM